MDDNECPICGNSGPIVHGGVLGYFEHDHRPDGSGLDDGPPLYPTRKKAAPKPAEDVAEIRARAWETRRSKYGPHGHR